MKKNTEKMHWQMAGLMTAATLFFRGTSDGR